MARTTIRCTISLPPKLAAQLDEVAEREYRTRSAVIQMLIRTHINENHRLGKTETVVHREGAGGPT